MSETLLIGGKIFSNVAGFKVTDDQSAIKTYVLSGGGSGQIVLLASGTYTKTDNATKPKELKIPVSFTGTPVEAYIYAPVLIPSVSQTCQNWRQYVGQSVVDNNWPSSMTRGISIARHSNGNYYKGSGTGLSLESNNTILTGNIVSSSYPYKDNTYNWYIWGYAS